MADISGKLVALCGIDASGKTTQTDLLRRRAQQEGWPVRDVSFPRYGQGFFADLVERYLHGDFAEKPAQVDPYLISLPYAADRWQAAPTLRTWLEQGCLVICNRYVPANLAHQGSKIRDEGPRREFFAWVLELEYEVFALPRPDLQILLDVPPEAALSLSGERARQTGVAEDIHEADADYLRQTANAYRQVADETPGPWAVVRCAPDGRLLPPQDIADMVWDRVAEIL